MKKPLLLALLVLVLAAPIAGADVLSTSATWTGWTAITTPNATTFGGTPYWNNKSWDGTGCNVGNWLSGTGGCDYTDFYKYSPGTGASYLGNGAATFSFTSEPSSITSIMGAVGVSWLSGTTEFGLFDTTTKAKTALITGGTMGTAVTFPVLSGSYGFYATVTKETGSKTYFSTALDSADKARFTIFNLSTATETKYAIGFEDIGGMDEASDYDYNDFVAIFTSKSVPVPEPASILLMGVGLVGCATMLRRRRAAR